MEGVLGGQNGSRTRFFSVRAMSANRFLPRVKSILRVDKQTLLERDRLDAEIRLESRHACFHKKLLEWQSETWFER